MGRLRTEQVRIDPALLHRTEEGVALTDAVLSDYSARLRTQGRHEDSVRSCGKTLRQFRDFLPESGIVTRDTLRDWRNRLLSENYAIRTVNSKVSVVNAPLESMGCRDLQATKQLLPAVFEAPELTRQEYLRMLQTARALEDERAYVLTKLFATTGIAVTDLPLVSVEAAGEGQLTASGKRGQTLRFSPGLQTDLLRYARES